MKSFKSVNLPALIIIMLAGVLAGILIFGKPKEPQVTTNPAPSPSPVIYQPAATSSVATNPTTTVPQKEIPKVYELKVPFTPQAPTANWDELHNEACEEASMIMSYAYFSGMKDAVLAPEFVEEEIAKLTQWEKDNFGYYLDINADETARVLKEVYGLNSKVIHSYTEEEIKRELMDGRLVLILANGQMLGNPNFRQPGPPYHMLVVKGWDSNNFITNDPGTRKGKNYPYTYETLYNAGGDWSHTIHGVDQGYKAAVVVWKE